KKRPPICRAVFSFWRDKKKLKTEGTEHAEERLAFLLSLKIGSCPGSQMSVCVSRFLAVFLRDLRVLRVHSRFFSPRLLERQPSFQIRNFELSWFCLSPMALSLIVWFLAASHALAYFQLTYTL